MIRRLRNLPAAICFLTIVVVAAAAPPPNVLILLADDQRFDTIHALGNSAIRTPHLDRLVKEGFAFTHAHIMGGRQGAICMPSRAMLMTGRTLYRAALPAAQGRPADHVIRTPAVLMPEVFRSAGYRTFAVGKWHNDKPSFNRAFTAGDAIFFGGMHDHEQVPVHSYDPTGAYPNNRRQTNRVFSSTLFANAAIQFLERHPVEQPFFLYVAFTAPHDPRTPPPEFAAMYRPEKIKLPPNFLPEHPFDNGELKVRDEKLLPWPRTPKAVQQEIAAYYGMISHLDAEIGRILNTLEARGLRRQTLVVFGGDNGLAVGQHGLLGKQNLYDHSVRVPLVFSGPGVPSNRRSAALCYLHDVFPTLCELSGLPVPPVVEGRSLVGIMQGREDKVYTTLYAAYREHQRMVRDERYKLLVYPQANRVQLFDLRKDPWETRDLSGEANFADVMEQLKKSLQEWQQTVEDPLFKP